MSRLLGVPAPTLRSWERRYGLATGAHRPGGHRRYDPDDVAILRRMRDEVAAGRSAATAGLLARVGIPALAENLRDTLLASADGLDARSVLPTLDRARDLLGLEQAVDQVVLPAMREVGRRWSAGEWDVAHEHLTTVAVSAWLARVRLDADPARQSRPVVLACGPRDDHRLALDCLTTVLEHRGIDCRLLAARTPVASLVLAVRSSEAAAAVVVSYLPATRPAAVEAIRAVAATPARLYYGGAAFRTPRSRSGLPGSHLGDGIGSAAERLVADLG